MENYETKLKNALEALKESGDEGAAKGAEIEEGFAFMKEEDFEETLIREFNEADTDGSGSLSFDQFWPVCSEACKDMEEDPENARAFFEQCDADSSGTMDVEEFFMFTICIVLQMGGNAVAKACAELGVECEEM